MSNMTTRLSIELSDMLEEAQALRSKLDDAYALDEMSVMKDLADLVLFCLRALKSQEDRYVDHIRNT